MPISYMGRYPGSYLPRAAAQNSVSPRQTNPKSSCWQRGAVGRLERRWTAASFDSIFAFSFRYDCGYSNYERNQGLEHLDSSR